MARSLSTAAKEAILAQQTSKVFLTLLDISHSEFESTFHFVDNPIPVIANGYIYEPFPFALTLPDDNAERAPQARLVVGNVTREIMDEIRSVGGGERIRIDFHILMSGQVATEEFLLLETGDFLLLENGDKLVQDEPVEVVASYSNYELRNISFDALAIQGDLILGDFLTEPFPPNRFTPNLFPALF